MSFLIIIICIVILFMVEGNRADLRDIKDNQEKIIEHLGIGEE